MAAAPRETDLYEPVKRLFEAQGYEVKSEVGPADVVALRGEEPPVIVELKTGFTLSLFHQAVERQRLCDAVYIAAPRGAGARFARTLKDNLTLCRRLGLGLITVRLRDGFVEVHADPAPYRPRPAPQRRTRLLREFQRRVGDPNTGGATRRGLVTAYRQDALRCLRHLAAEGPTKASAAAQATGVSKARQIMADDHYGWFERVARGVYDLTPKGRQAVGDYAAEIAAIAAEDEAPRDAGR